MPLQIVIIQQVREVIKNHEIYNAVLTGCIGSEKTISLKDNTDKQILEIALRPLAITLQ